MDKHHNHIITISLDIITDNVNNNKLLLTIIVNFSLQVQSIVKIELQIIKMLRKELSME